MSELRNQHAAQAAEIALLKGANADLRGLNANLNARNCTLTRILRERFDRRVRIEDWAGDHAARASDPTGFSDGLL